MNTTASSATIFTDDTVDMRGPVVPGPTLLEWARAAEGIDDPSLDDEIRALDAGTSPSRRLHGHYLRHAFDDIAASARRRGIDVVTHRSRAIDLEDQGAGQIVVLDNGEHVRVDAVILCLGHVDSSAPNRRAHHRHIPPGAIVDQDIGALNAGEDVLVRGTGLGLYDLIAMISHERGGHFEPSPYGPLRYVPSGKEPRLWVGSRRGYPFRSKPILGAGSRWTFYGPTDEKLASLHARRGDLSFRDDLWPLIVAGAAATFIEVSGGHADDVALCVAALDDSSLMPTALDAVARVSGGRWEPALSADPLHGMTFADHDALHDHVKTLLHADLRESRKGLASAAKAADFAIGASRGWLRALTVHGGVRPTSQRDELDGWFEGYANVLAGGPPHGRASELAALADVGIVRFVGADMQVECHSVGYRAQSSSVPGAKIEATALVDARLGPFRVDQSADPLVVRMRQSGKIRSHVQLRSGERYDDRRLDVDSLSRRVLDYHGQMHPKRFAIGVPVGGSGAATFTAMARTSSPFLAETDAVAINLLNAVGLSATGSPA